MAAGQFIAELEGITVELEDMLAEIEAGDLQVASGAEKSLRQIFEQLQADAEFRVQAGVMRLDTRSRGTRRAVRKALRDIDTWREDTKARLRSDPAMLSAIQDTSRRLAEMNRVIDSAVDSWTRVIRRLSDPESFTPAQIAEAKQLSKDTAFYRRVFNDYEDYLESQGVAASFGKAENVAAEVDRVFRQARNFVHEFSTSAPLFRAGESDAPRARESTLDELVNAKRTLAFNRNNLTLSSVGHARGLFSAALIAIAQPLGVCHFILYLSRQSRKQASGWTAEHLFDVRLGVPDGGSLSVFPGGDRASWSERVAAMVGRDTQDVLAEARRRAAQRTEGEGTEGSAQDVREMLSRILVEAEGDLSWPALWERVNEQRRETVVWGAPLTTYHNSREVFYPVPPSMVAEMRSWSASVRLRRAA